MADGVQLAVADEFDLFLDLSQSGLGPAELRGHLDRLRRETGLIVEGRCVTVCPPAGVSEANLDVPSVVMRPGATALSAALSIAASRERALAVVRHAWTPMNELVAALVERQRVDPMIGVVQPRFARLDDDRIIGLPRGDAAEVMLPRAAAPFLPEIVLTPELPAAHFVITAQAVLAVQPPAHCPPAAMLPSVLLALRRRGFRTLVASRVIARFPLDPQLAYGPTDATGGPFPDDDVALARRHLSRLPELALEELLANAFSTDGRPRLLLDARGMQAMYNGTSQAILGYLQGFDALAPPNLEITVLATSGAARFHDLERRFPKFRYRFDRLEGSYVAAVLLNQPWSIEAMVDLHGRAVFVVFNMFDTISWDILYPGPEGLDEVWRMMGRLADGLLFISDYTRRRFCFRFRPDPMVPLVVTHLSVDPSETMLGPLGKSQLVEPYLLVFGNDYDHKAVGPTLMTLTDAFPFLLIVALGPDRAASPRVTCLRSGGLAESEIDNLVGHAAAIVYPSVYEGFGLPVVHGLARGRTVIVRHSPLWDEIAAISQLPGRIAPFHDELSLVRAVGAVLHGGEVHTIAGARSPDCELTSPNWRDCAKRIAELVRRLAYTRDGTRWVERQVYLRRLAEARGST
jgi:glycosyltransferase involved in cell wall biosynthesis